jgi:peptide/nickel transport system permease protein
MLTVIRDLLKHDGRFRVAFIFLLLTLILAALSLISPYAPNRTFLVPQDMPPSLAHPFGTNSRGQDLLVVDGLCRAQFACCWALSLRRRLAHHCHVCRPDGWLPRRNWIGRVLMSINDSFVVLPILPILILLSFLLRRAA